MEKENKKIKRILTKSYTENNNYTHKYNPKAMKKSQKIHEKYTVDIETPFSPHSSAT